MISVGPDRQTRAAFFTPKRICAGFLICSGMIAVGTWAHGQQPPPPQQPAQNTQKQATAPQNAQASRPSLKVISQMVQVDVIAKDRDGNPVRDLKQSDFTVYDNGKKQEIAWFSLETNKTKNQPTPPVAPDTYSNLVEQKTRVPGNLTIILLDYLNTKHSDLVSARNQVITLLREIKPEDRVAIYAMKRQIYVLQDFTNDSPALKRAVQSYDTTDSTDLAAASFVPSDTGVAAFDNFMNEANQKFADFSTIDRMHITTQVFEIISQHMLRIPGRKNLIWVSGSFPFSMNLSADMEGSPYTQSGPGAFTTPGFGSGGKGGATASAGGPNLPEREEFVDEVTEASRQLATANIAIYPVDALGVAPGAFSPGSMPIAGGDPSTTPGSMLSTNLDSMFFLAEHTGGLVFTGTPEENSTTSK